MNEMKNKNKKAFLLVKLLALMSIVSVIGYQLAFGISGIFAQEQSLSLTTEFDSEELAADEQFTVKISDQRSISEIVTTENTDLPYVDQSQSLTETSSSEVSIKREYTMVLPEGISFDQTIQNEWQTETDYTGALPEFSFDEDSRELKISVDASATEVGIRLTAAAAGSYQLQVKDANLTESSEAVTVEVGEAKADGQASEESTESDEESISSVRSAAVLADTGTNVTNWQEFVTALATPSVSQINLTNDISLSGTLANYSSLFSVDSINLDSAQNSYLYVSKNGVARTLAINGNGYTFDFGNLAIGFLNSSSYVSGSSGTVAGYWNLSFANINFVSSNYSGPFSLTSHTGAEVAAEGLTGAPRTNAAISYDKTSTTNTRLVSDFLGYSIAINDFSVSNVRLTSDLIATATTYSSSYYIYSPYTKAADNVSNATSYGNTSGGETHVYFYLQGNARTIAIDGQGYTVDFGAICFDFTSNNNNGSAVWDITYSNMNVYHGNYYGTMIFSNGANGGTMRFDNYAGIGNQFLESTNANVVMKNTVSMTQQNNWTSKKKDGTSIRTWALNNQYQQNLNVTNVTIEDNANIHIESRGTNVITLNNGGNFTVGENATVDVIRGSEINTTEGYAVNIDVRGSVSIGRGSTVNLTNHNSTYGAALLMNSSTASLTVAEDANLNIVVDNYSGSTNGNNQYNPIYMSSGSINVSGNLSVKGTNMGNSATSLLYGSNNVSFVIASGGSFDVQSDSTSTSQYLLYMSGSGSTFKFTDAERVNLQRTSTMTSATATNNGLIYSGGNLGVSVQNVYQWALGNKDSGTTGDGGYTYSYVPMSSMNLSYSSYTPTITSANSMTTATLNSFKTNFTTRGQQRVLFTRIEDPSVSILNEPNDNPTSADSHTVSGYAIPGTYIRVWEEALNGTTSAKANGTADNVASPVEDTTMPATTRANYTTIADSNGDWSVDLTTLGIDKTFTAENVIHVYAFSNLKSEEITAVVLDKTPPNGTVSAQTTYYDAPIAASAFVDSASIADTNPTLTLPTDITISFDQATTNVDAYTWLTNGTGTLTKGEYAVGINLTDPAGNTTTYATTLTVKNYSKDIVISMVNEAGATINADLVPNQATTYTATVPEDDTSLTISDDADLVSFIQAIIATGYYQLADENWQAGTINFTDLTATFAFQGVLKFGDVTSALKFKDTRISFIDQTVLPEDDFDMGIVDTRAAGTTAKGGNWSITAKMSSDFTNGTNTLKNILYYQGDSGSPIAIDSTNDTTIFTQTNASESAVPVTTSINWTASGAVGLRLLLPTGTTTTGDYQGTIQWGLNDTY